MEVLTAIGTLDGAGLSYLAREARETLDIDLTLPELKGRFPVHIVDRVNHAQVASGTFLGIDESGAKTLSRTASNVFFSLIVYLFSNLRTQPYSL